jgi:hydroxypyruvate isomerase
MTFQLAACAEMLWRDKPIDWRARRLKDLGFGVGLWDWPGLDLAKLEATGATFTIMNGYLRGRLTDDEGAAELIKTARETATVGASACNTSTSMARDWETGDCRSSPSMW